jgi:hypothetical protein
MNFPYTPTPMRADVVQYISSSFNSSNKHKDENPKNEGKVCAQSATQARITVHVARLSISINRKTSQFSLRVCQHRVP